MAYREAAILMTLSSLQGHLHIASFFTWKFSYRCATIDKFSTDSASCGLSAIA